jgi:hypothetical protein
MSTSVTATATTSNQRWNKQTSISVDRLTNHDRRRFRVCFRETFAQHKAGIDDDGVERLLAIRHCNLDRFLGGALCKAVRIAVFNTAIRIPIVFREFVAVWLVGTLNGGDARRVHQSFVCFGKTFQEYYCFIAFTIYIL